MVLHHVIDNVQWYAQIGIVHNPTTRSRCGSQIRQHWKRDAGERVLANETSLPVAGGEVTPVRDEAAV